MIVLIRRAVVSASVWDEKATPEPGTGPFGQTTVLGPLYGDDLVRREPLNREGRDIRLRCSVQR
jgi:hypothetical protein